MKKSSVVVIVGMLVAFVCGGWVQASNDEEQKIKEFASENGYVSMEEAVEQFQETHHVHVSLPTKKLFEPTHSFGKITDHHELRLHYIDISNIPHQDFIMDIKYPSAKIMDDIHEGSTIIELKTGQEAYYRYLEDAKLHFLSFKEGQFSYTIGVQEKENQKVCAETIKEVAELIR
ncbi:hypothetical protein [Alteribacter aurantiacus]|uniref:hypothetical protein n=1 Tax=Alteribacter aurantiacus TaxID=254410 RepID=UPI0004263A45|nr:hypothetical protein [Alteribacter aurantiacus]